VHRMSPASPRVFALALVGTLSLVLLATCSGSVPIRYTEIIASLLGRPILGREWVQNVLFQVRLPRVLAAWLVGASLSHCGVVLQTLFHNPLAEPGVLGVSATASLFAVAAIFLGLGAIHPAAVPLAAFVGSLVATALLWGQSRRFRGPHETILLLGVGLGQIAFAFTSLIVSLSLGNWEIAQKLMTWLLGSLEGSGWSHVLLALGPMASAMVWGVYRGRELDALLLGEISATSLGVDVPRLRLEVILISSLLTGVSVAIGGVVPFVGLIVPHVVRHWSGPLHARLSLLCTFAGGAFLVLSDLVARRLVAPEELRLGVVTALLGAPLFVFILTRHLAERTR
jgi:iron complex transport system permease protein